MLLARSCITIIVSQVLDESPARFDSLVIDELPVDKL